MPQIIAVIKVELEYLFDYVFSIFSPKYRNEAMCVLFGLPILYLYDHPILINKILNHIP
jgi:hypothetical protein